MSLRRDIGVLAATVIALGGLIGTYLTWLHVSNPLIVGFTSLLVVLPAAATARLWVPATVSVLAMLGFNFFFLAPVGTLYLADPQNWVALFVFLTVSLVASNLSTAARARAREAVNRQEELTRLFDVSRDVLLTPDGSDAITELARCITRRFVLDSAAICLPRSGQWEIYEAGTPPTSDKVHLALALGTAESSDGRELGGSAVRGHRTVAIKGQSVRLVPLRLGTRSVGLLAAAGRPIEPGMLDALAGVAAIAIERAQVQPTLLRHRVELQVESDEMVKIDPRLTASALARVLENAAQYSPAASQIAVSAHVSSDGLTLSVRDHGPGIAFNDLPHVFERFYRGTESKRRVSGTGMGLSIARGLLAAEHGRIDVTNCADGGAQFTLVVPAERKMAASLGSDS